jgi:hypothetical protein
MSPYLGGPIAPSYVSPNAGVGGGTLLSIRNFVIRNFVIRNFVIRNFVIRNFVPVPEGGGGASQSMSTAVHVT